MATADAHASFLALLSGRRSSAASFETLWQQALRGFPGPALDEWLSECRHLASGPLDAALMLAYLRASPALAAAFGPPSARALGQAMAGIARDAGGPAAEALARAAADASRRLRSAERFGAWLEIVERLAGLAPESLEALLERTERLLETLDSENLLAWALSGIRAAGGDPERRRLFFRFDDPVAGRWLARGGGSTPFSLLERRLKIYVTALWGQNLVVRAAGVTAGELPRRTSFDENFIRVPEVFPGVPDGQSAALFRAALAHAAAHLHFGGSRFPIGSLKPLQIALVSLIEDARVEQLAIDELPGLKRLWLPFHEAAAGGALTAPALLARLARALLDPTFVDGHAWVEKGREMFLAECARWADPAISRAIGSLLGNDLGQMRVQFNPRTHVVEPAYRDDNLGLWDFGDQAEATGEAETIIQSARIEQAQEREAPPPERERQDPAQAASHESPAPRRLKPEVVEDVGIPVAHYAEWDYLIGRARADWTTVLEFAGRTGEPAMIDRILERQARLVTRIETLIRSAKVSRPVRLRRQAEGDTLDLDACIAAEIDRRLGQAPDPGLYSVLIRRHRDLSSLVLLDISQSTGDEVPGAGASVLTLEREAATLIAHAMAKLGDNFALRAFCSDGRAAVGYHLIKDFAEPFDRRIFSRLAGLESRLSTRMGTALRHAGAELDGQRSHRRLLLIVTDGEPSDVDVGDHKYLVEDARHAVLELGHKGIDVFCVGLDSGGDNYLARIFGRRSVLQIDRIEHLPEKLPMLYLRLTA